MAITLAELKTQARQMADMEQSQFVTDAELTNYINFAIAELHDLLVQTYGSDYFLESVEGTTTSGTANYALPADFYKLRGIDVRLNGTDWFTVPPFNFNERNKYERFGSWTLLGISNIRYRVMGGNLKLTPTPDSNVDYRLWYIPVASKLSADTDSLNDVNQYSDYVIVTAAMKMRHKEESDIRALAAERGRIVERIEQAAQNRDAGQSEQITDIYADNTDYIFYTSDS